MFFRIGDQFKMNRRPIYIFLLLSGLAFLSYFSIHIHPWISVADCLENPTKYDKVVVTSYYEPTIGKLHPDGFDLLQKRNPSIRVYSDTAGLSEGEYIGLKAVFHKEGYLKAIDLVVAKKRREKIWISILPTILIGMLLVKYFRFDPKRFQIELKKHA
jgi:hypothetical protein